MTERQIDRYDIYCTYIYIYIEIERERTHWLLESREVAVDGAGTEVVDKRQVFTDVFHRPAAEERVQQALVPSCEQQVQYE